ncbi:MAG: hypothetical protein H0X24_00685 [Ktedonobacterales bacterium]|nr:hypothetical protein [Ktedonobacterales bacterium]
MDTIHLLLGALVGISFMVLAGAGAAWFSLESSLSSTKNEDKVPLASLNSRRVMTQNIVAVVLLGINVVLGMLFASVISHTTDSRGHTLPPAAPIDSLAYWMLVGLFVVIQAIIMAIFIPNVWRTYRLTRRNEEQTPELVEALRYLGRQKNSRGE